MRGTRALGQQFQLNAIDLEIYLSIGGPGGGVFVFVKKHHDFDTKLYLAKIFYASGDVAYDGLMKLYPDNSSEFDVENKESFVGWDGDNLYLSNNRWLKVQE